MQASGVQGAIAHIPSLHLPLVEIGTFTNVLVCHTGISGRVYTTGALSSLLFLDSYSVRSVYVHATANTPPVPYVKSLRSGVREFRRPCTGPLLTTCVFSDSVVDVEVKSELARGWQTALRELLGQIPVQAPIDEPPSPSPSILYLALGFHHIQISSHAHSPSG